MRSGLIPSGGVCVQQQTKIALHTANAPILHMSSRQQAAHSFCIQHPVAFNGAVKQLVEYFFLLCIMYPEGPSRDSCQDCLRQHFGSDALASFSCQFLRFLAGIHTTNQMPPVLHRHLILFTIPYAPAYLPKRIPTGNKGHAFLHCCAGFPCSNNVTRCARLHRELHRVLPP